MNRRKVDAVRGFVNFPVSDDRYTHTREGGHVCENYGSHE